MMTSVTAYNSDILTVKLQKPNVPINITVSVSGPLSGKAGNVREFHGCQGNVREFGKIQGIVSGNSYHVNFLSHHYNVMIC